MLIKVANVSKSYPQPLLATPPAAIENISFTIEEGEFVCILGPSGCGKSTLLNLIAGFMAPDRGHIEFAGQKVTAPGPERGVVFQEATLFPWLNIRRNIELGLKATGIEKSHLQQIIDDVLRLVDLHCSQQSYPHQLSGGMKQRLALARVLALQPQLLLMDEPFSALDAETREHLQDQLLNICSQKRQTVLFVTHSVEEAAYLADRVLIMGPPPASLFNEVTIQRNQPRTRSAKELTLTILRLRTLLKELSRNVPEPQQHKDAV